MANPSKSGYEAWNKKVLYEGLKVYAKNAITPKVIDVLTRVAQGIVDAIDGGTFEIPIYTGNLKDSTGVAVYADGVIKSFIPTKTAGKLHKSGFDGVNHYAIDGTQFLQNTINEAATTFSKGIWFVVLSTVPYAYRINTQGSPLGRGIGFFDRTVRESVAEVVAGLRPISDEIAIAPM